MGRLLFLVKFILLIAVVAAENTNNSLDFYSFSAADINGRIVPFEEYRGKVTLVVNVASQCGWTDNHYKGLNLLNKWFSHTGRFNILAFPCNQFGGQEPGSNSEISDFAYNVMGASFSLFSKVNVLGENVPPPWKYLTEQTYTPNWNFWKYLVNPDGKVIGAWGPNISPEELYQVIEKTLSSSQASMQEKEGKRNEL